MPRATLPPAAREEIKCDMRERKRQNSKTKVQRNYDKKIWEELDKTEEKQEGKNYKDILKNTIRV
jgi:predicted alpha-1,6-mannanase (GH76 family)